MVVSALTLSAGVPRPKQPVLLPSSTSATLPASGAAESPAPVTAFVNVAVIPMDRERVLPHQTVVVRGDRITALGPVTQVPVPPDAVQVSGEGRYLMPGLADMHVHLWYPRMPLGDTLHAADLLLAFVANGVTTVRDMHSGDTDSWTLRLRRRVAAGEVVGPRIYTAGDPDKSTPAAAAASVAELKAAGHDFVKFYGWDQPLYDSIVLPARRLGLRVVGHAPDDLALLSRSGTAQVVSPQGNSAIEVAHVLDTWASIEHLSGYDRYLIRDGVRVEQAALQELALATQRGGVWNCPTLTVVNLGRHSIDPYLQITKALHDAGAGLLLGTDAAHSPPLPLYGFSIHQELAWLVAAGLTPYEALATGTRNVAEFLGTQDSTGTVAVGKRADLVLLKRNPLIHISSTKALAGVMVGGRWLAQEELNQRLDSVAPIPINPDPTRSFTWRLLVRLARDFVGP